VIRAHLLPAFGELLVESGPQESARAVVSAGAEPGGVRSLNHGAIDFVRYRNLAACEQLPATHSREGVGNRKERDRRGDVIATHRAPVECPSQTVLVVSRRPRPQARPSRSLRRWSPMRPAASVRYGTATVNPDPVGRFWPLLVSNS
jgi:hypothetical protein